MRPEVDNQKLIEAVKRRPMLYNKSDPMYFSHNKHKYKVWSDVCREVFHQWDSYKPQDRVEYRHDLQKRWKNLRTCFAREILLQKKGRMIHLKDGRAVKRRKRYEYFNQMSFLLNSDVTTDNIEITKEDDNNSSDPLQSFKIECLYEEEDAAEEPCEVPSTRHMMPYYENNDNSSATQEKIVEILNELKKDREDEDRQFMLSLVQSFKKLSDKQKFEAKIRILKVIKEITFEEYDT